jgi:hypothetical protein
MLARTPLVVAANTAQSVRIEIFLYITTYLDGNTEKSKSRALFVEATNLLRVAMKAELESAVNLPIGRTETTPLAKNRCYGRGEGGVRVYDNCPGDRGGGSFHNCAL